MNEFEKQSDDCSNRVLSSTLVEGGKSNDLEFFI